MTKYEVTCTISLFFLEKKSEIWNAFTLFENWKVNFVFLSLISRMKSEMKMPWDREWKVKWKFLKIESEKWNEFASRSRSVIFKLPWSLEHLCPLPLAVVKGIRRSCSLQHVLYNVETSFCVLDWRQGFSQFFLIMTIPFIQNLRKHLSSPSWLVLLPSLRCFQSMAILVLLGVFICPTLLCSNNKGLWGSSWELL